MILTCPACDTKYVVKDGAIPPGGRQVRCASCKHSWHQDPEPSVGRAGKRQAGRFRRPAAARARSRSNSRWPRSAEAEARKARSPASRSRKWPRRTSRRGARFHRRRLNRQCARRAGRPDEVAMEEAPAIADDWRASPSDELDAARPRRRRPSRSRPRKICRLCADRRTRTSRAARWPVILGCWSWSSPQPRPSGSSRRRNGRRGPGSPRPAQRRCS